MIASQPDRSVGIELTGPVRLAFQSHVLSMSKEQLVILSVLVALILKQSTVLRRFRVKSPLSPSPGSAGIAVELEAQRWTLSLFSTPAG